MLVAMKPLAADACMNPLLPVDKSRIDVSRALCPGCPGTGASLMWITRWSPGFISRVFLLGVLVARFASCGLGGPAGTPLVAMKAKFVGSMQLPLELAKIVVHSRSLICSDAHPWGLSQLILSTRGALPGGSTCIYRTERPPPGNTPGGTGALTVPGALASLFGWQGSSG